MKFHIYTQIPQPVTIVKEINAGISRHNKRD